MFIRRARASDGEDWKAGEYVCSYTDAMMADKKEDGFATFSAFYLAVKVHCAHLALELLSTWE